MPSPPGEVALDRAADGRMWVACTRGATLTYPLPSGDEAAAGLDSVRRRGGRGRVVTMHVSSGAGSGGGRLWALRIAG